MENKVKEGITKVEVYPESINVDGRENGVMWVKVVNTYTEDIDVSSIWDTYNIDTINYPIDPNIVVALKDNEPQLVNYLNVCKKLYESNSPTISKEALDDIPLIYYQYDDLLNSFRDEEDENTRKRKQLELYKMAKTMVDLFKNIKNKVILKMGIFKQAYYNIQKLLYKSSNYSLALNPGTEEKKNLFTESLKVKPKTQQKNEYIPEHTVEKEKDTDKIK